MTRTINLPIHPPGTPEHELARHWRETIMGLSKPTLSLLTGYSVSSITDYELGRVRGQGKPVDAAAMQRYRLACAAVAAALVFDWKVCETTIHKWETVDLTQVPRSPRA